MATDSAPSGDRPLLPRSLTGALAGIAAVAVVTAGLVALRGALDKAHVALVYLLVVLAASAWRGRRVGLAVAVLCFVCFEFFLLPPYRRIGLDAPLDWLVLAVFLITSIVAASLLDRAQRAEALRHADRLKDALLAAVSHDLRTPLTTIKALAHDMRVDGDERAAVVEIEADRLNRLVADLLDLSRLDAGALRLEPGLNAADDLLGAALDRLAGMPRAADVRARLDASEPVVGRFDFVHSLRALVNLVENALKYSPPGSPVEVVVRREGDDVVFAVLDRGPGLPSGAADRIFDPFYRAPAATPDVSGAGLGLAIARRLAEAQGGTIRYAPRPGGGSVFSLHLPAADLAELGARPS